MPGLPPREVMIAAFNSRDESFDGAFFAAVSTTGIFCRPSCPARKADPRNITFYASPAEALFAGYRPCKRCAPLAAAEDPAWIASLLRAVEDDPDVRIRDADLRARGLEPATVRRRFKSRYGLTFQAYQRARRLASAFESIKEGGSVDDAVFDSGYESHSGFREAFSRLFGEPPGRAARGSDFIRLAWIETAFGPALAGAVDEGICFLEFSDRRMLEAQASTLARRLRRAAAPAPHPLLEELRVRLGEYLSGERREFDLPIHEPGTAFQERVWAALRAIPYGETRSYAELARMIGEPTAIRAVARANGMNRIAILVPCHRVIGSDGGLGGYGGGVWRKAKLLEIEGARRVSTDGARRP